MKSFVKILGTTVGVVLVALFVLGWAPDVTNFSSTQFGNDGSTVYIKSSASVTNLQVYNGLTVTNPATGSFINITNGNITASGLVTATNGFSGSQAMTVATLPSSPVVGQYVPWVTDAITSVGTGSAVYYDGANWRLISSRIIVTADIPTFIRNAYAALYTGNTPMSYINGVSQNHAVSSLIGRSSTVSGSGSSVGLNNGSSYGDVLLYAAGTTSNGNAISVCQYIAPISANYYIGSGVIYYLGGTLPDGTDNYWCLVGSANNASSSFPTSGAFFIYDRYTNAIPYGTVPSGATSNWTNDWLCITANSSSYTVSDSGFVASISPTLSRLWVTYTNGAALFYTNNVLAITHTSNLPLSALYVYKLEVQKTLGSTTKYIIEIAPGVHVRQPAYSPFP